MQTNPEIELAWQCVESTGSHLFLTGKAGTGKTTFLRQLKQQSPKRMIVVAPTGISAINAGGVTIHSFFQLPFAPYIPETTFNAGKAVYRFGRDKIKIIRSIDLLVIDEVSMVRADLLDAIDSVLRRYRDRYKPFGGVQLLLIGDLQQLAPVVKEDEWALLSKHYTTPYFFGSLALKATSFITIQLEQVYRQSDTKFLTLLNRIRTNDIDHDLLDELNKRFIPGFHPRDEEGYITLTTHNYQAQRINDRYLAALPGRPFIYKAEISGQFPEFAYPADVNLALKPGAQVMFIKNDSSNQKRYYNGKIGEVLSIESDWIRVRGKGESQDFLLEKEEWSNSKYTLNEQSKEIVEEIEGIFKQYPVRLAWAITIHKSQGLTFERAIIDASMSFTHGQTYVALSRCKTLEGMVLGKPLTEEAVICDETVNTFTRNVENSVPNEAQLNKLMKAYLYELIHEQFDFSFITRQFSALKRLFDEFFYKLYPKQFERYKTNYQRYLDEIEKVTIRFQQQYTSLVNASEDYMNDNTLQKRLQLGAQYFLEKTEEIVFSLLRETVINTDNKELAKKYMEIYDALFESLKVKTGTLEYTSKEGFHVAGYLKNKAFILLSLDDKTKPNSSKKSKKKTQSDTDKIIVSDDILHPELYTRLVRWRKAQVMRTNMPVYVILQQKALMGITNLLPTTKEELEMIPYLGKKGIEKHGEALIAIVSGYIKEYGIQKGDIF